MWDARLAERSEAAHATTRIKGRHASSGQRTTHGRTSGIASTPGSRQELVRQIHARVNPARRIRAVRLPRSPLFLKLRQILGRANTVLYPLLRHRFGPETLALTGPNRPDPGDSKKSLGGGAIRHRAPLACIPITRQRMVADSPYKCMAQIM